MTIGCPRWLARAEWCRPADPFPCIRPVLGEEHVCHGLGPCRPYQPKFSVVTPAALSKRDLRLAAGCYPMTLTLHPDMVSRKAPAPNDKCGEIAAVHNGTLRRGGVRLTDFNFAGRRSNSTATCFPGKIEICKPDPKTVTSSTARKTVVLPFGASRGSLDRVSRKALAAGLGRESEAFPFTGVNAVRPFPAHEVAGVDVPKSRFLRHSRKQLPSQADTRLGGIRNDHPQRLAKANCGVNAIRGPGLLDESVGSQRRHRPGKPVRPNP